MDILQFINGSTLPTRATLILACVMGFFIYFKEEISQGIKTKLSGKKIDLKQHDIFFKINHYIKHTLPTMPFHNTNEVRNEMVKDFVEIKLKTHLNFLEKFLESKSVESMSAKELKDNFCKDFLDAVDFSNEKCIKQGIPKVFIESYIKTRKDKKQEFINLVDDFCRSPLLSTNTQTMVVVLYAYGTLIDNFIIDAEKTISSINGKLNDHKYKGKIIGEGEKKNYLY